MLYSHDLVQTATAELVGFLLAHLPALGDDWWTTHVEKHLSFDQKRRVKGGVGTLDQLDFAALLRVFDRNWYELSQPLNLPREGRNWVRELQTVRNKWAHRSARPMPASDVYRDMDTLGRFLVMLGAKRESVAAVEAAKTAAFDDMAVAHGVPGSSAPVGGTSAPADQEMTQTDAAVSSVPPATAMGRMNKSAAIKRVNSCLQRDVLDGTNTRFSNVNSARDVWWFNIPLKKFEQELHLLCAGKAGLIWLTIEANSVPNPEGTFRLRQDKGLIDFEISCAPERYMRDVKSGGSGYDFRPHIRRKWSWNTKPEEIIERQRDRRTRE